jgi:hypothetical protein
MLYEDGGGKKDELDVVKNEFPQSKFQHHKSNG